MTPESFLQHRRGHGVSRYRFESLPENARETCLARVLERLEGAGPAAYVSRADVVYAIGVAYPPPPDGTR